MHTSDIYTNVYIYPHIQLFLCVYKEFIPECSVDLSSLHKVVYYLHGASIYPSSYFQPSLHSYNTSYNVNAMLVLTLNCLGKGEIVYVQHRCNFTPVLLNCACWICGCRTCRHKRSILCMHTDTQKNPHLKLKITDATASASDTARWTMRHMNVVLGKEEERERQLVCEHSEEHHIGNQMLWLEWSASFLIDWPKAVVALTLPQETIRAECRNSWRIAWRAKHHSSECYIHHFLVRLYIICCISKQHIVYFCYFWKMAQ